VERQSKGEGRIGVEREGGGRERRKEGGRGWVHRHHLV